MGEISLIPSNNKKIYQKITGLKVIEFNVSDNTETLYAVVTPVKNNG